MELKYVGVILNLTWTFKGMVHTESILRCGLSEEKAFDIYCSNVISLSSTQLHRELYVKYDATTWQFNFLFGKEDEALFQCNFL